MAIDETVLEALETPGPENVEKALSEVLEKAQVSKALAEAARGALRLLSRYKDQIPQDVMTKLLEVAGYGYPEPQMKQRSQQYGKPDEYGKPDKMKKEEGDEINKADLPEPVRKRMEDLERRAEEAERIAKAEREARLNREYVEKAEREYGYIAKADELGPVLRAIDERLEKADADRLHSWLRAANERLAKSALFDEFGRSGLEDGAASRIEKRVEEILKAEPKLTREQAYVRALEQNPDLYAEYLREGVR